jgi:excisionase family DNA binding protein
METKQDLLTLEEAAFLLKVGIPTVESLIHRGMLAAEREGGAFTIRRQDLLAHMRRNQQELEQNDNSQTPQDFGMMGKRTDE